MKCSNCGADNDVNARFCNACGQPMSAAPPDLPAPEPTVVQPMPPEPTPPEPTVVPWAPPAPTPPTPPAAPKPGKAVSMPTGAIAAIVVVALALAGVLVWALATRGAGGSKAVGTTKPPVTPSSTTVTSSQTPTPTTSVSASASSNGFPDANEQALLAHIPADTARTCTRYTAPLGSPIAAVYCIPSPGVNDVQYNLYSTTADMNQAYTAANASGISGGDCSAQTTAEYPWYFTDGTTAGGRVFCFRTAQNTSAIYWTYDDLQIMAWASRDDTDNKALYQFWLTAGPNA